MINLQFQYKPLFKVKATHEFFTENAAGGFTFVPTARTVELCKKMSFLIKHPNNDEIHILGDYYRQDAFRQFLLNESESTLKLSFYLYSKNPYFVNITNIPTELPGNIFYFSNLHLDAKGSGNLSRSKFVTPEDLYVVSDPANTTTANNDENNVYQVMQHFLKNESSITKGSSRPSDEGLYKVLLNEKEIQKFVHIGSIKGAPIGFIDIILTKEIQEQIIRGIEDDEPMSYNYMVNFDTREVYWKYVIIPRYLKRAKNFEISQQKGKESISFKKDADSDTNENQISFTSETPIKFRDMYDFELQLKKKDAGDGAGKIIIQNLPYAPFDSIKPFLKEKITEKFYSDIYIYI
jgi:hypothetical protein